MKKLSNN